MTVKHTLGFAYLASKNFGGIRLKCCLTCKVDFTSKSRKTKMDPPIFNVMAYGERGIR